MPEHDDAHDPTASTGKTTWRTRVDPDAGARRGGGTAGGAGTTGGAGAPPSAGPAGAPGEAKLPTWQQTPRATPPPMGRPAPVTSTTAGTTTARATALRPAAAPAAASPTAPGPRTSAATTTAPAATAGTFTTTAPTTTGGTFTTTAPTATAAPATHPAAGPAATATPAGSPAQPPTQPPARPATRVRRHISSALRRWRLPLAAALPCLVLAGAGWWYWPSQPGPVPLHLVAGTVHAALLTPDEASRLTGMTLISGPRAAEPADALTAAPTSCAVAVGPGTRSVFGKDWTAFLSATYQDAGGLGDYTMTQVAGVYPDSGKAGAVLRTLTAGLRSCPSAVRTDQGQGSSRWTYRVDETTADGVAWTAVQDGGDGWACYRRAQLKGAALLQVGICEAGDGRPTVRTAMQRLAAGVGA